MKNLYGENYKGNITNFIKTKEFDIFFEIKNGRNNEKNLFFLKL